MVNMSDLQHRINVLEKAVEQLQAQVNTHAVAAGKPEMQLPHAPKNPPGLGVVGVKG